MLRKSTVRSIFMMTTFTILTGKPIFVSPFRKTCAVGFMRSSSLARGTKTGCRSLCCPRKASGEQRYACWFPLSPMQFMGTTPAPISTTAGASASATGTPFRTIQPIIRSTGFRPTTTTAMAAAFASRHTDDHCSICVRATSPLAKGRVPGCGIFRRIRTSTLGWRRRVSPMI